MNNLNKNKITAFNNIDELLVKEKSYLNIIKGYCENNMNKSEALADIWFIADEACKLHNKLLETVDNMIIELG